MPSLGLFLVTVKFSGSAAWDYFSLLLLVVTKGSDIVWADIFIAEVVWTLVSAQGCGCVASEA